MENQFITANDKLEFRQIVLGHIKRILEISSHELRDGTHIVNHGNFSETKYQEDTRESYIQAIENLSYVLIPYFDDKIEKVYPSYIEIITSFGFQVKEILKEEYKKIKEEVGEEKVNPAYFALEMRVKYAKKLFIELNLLLKRVDYLRSAIYSEEEEMGEAQ